MHLLAIGDVDTTYYSSLRYSTDNSIHSQSFLTDAGQSFYVTGVWLQMWKAGSPTGNFWVEIHSSQEGTSATKDESTNIVGEASDNLTVASLTTSPVWHYLQFTGTIPILDADTTYYLMMYADCAISTSNFVKVTLNVGDIYDDGEVFKIDDALEWSDVEHWEFTFIIEGYQLFTESITCSDSYRGSLSAGSDYEYYLAADSGAVYEYGLSYKGDAGSAVTCSWVSKNTDFTDKEVQPDIFKTVYSVKLLYLDNDSSVQTTVYLSTDDGTTWVTSPIGTRSLGTGSGQVKTETWYFPGGKTGQFFKFKIESAGTTTRPQWLGLEIDYITRGEHFNIT